jgi:hypothetical protein
MNPSDTPHSPQRETVLIAGLLLVVGIPVFVFFNLITFGLFVLLFLLAGFIALMGAVNYFLWGRSFTRETAWEREETLMGDPWDSRWTSDVPEDDPRY